MKDSLQPLYMDLTLDSLEDGTEESSLIGTRCLTGPLLVGNDLSSVAPLGELGPSPRAFQEVPFSVSSMTRFQYK